MTLDPDAIEMAEPVYVDLSVEMRNNLFRKGSVNPLPIPATAGNWVIKDNLFDNVEFLQVLWKPTWPIDHDYNAYFPLTEFACPGWGTARLLNPDLTTAANDRILTSPPAYETGPFGDFYLATSCPLYDSANRGSRSVADAGVYHHTTRTDQTKDGDQTGNVIIGRHYIATASSSSSDPMDTDGDLIPDYVENWHGDGDDDGNGGRLHADTETDWRVAYTVSGVYDPTNALYDDVDLSGDGLVGRIKKALDPANPQPLVPDNPLALTPVTVIGADPRTLTFRVDLDYTTVTNIGRLQLVVDGCPLSLAEPETGTGLCLLTWNTAFAAPGYHLLNARLAVNGIPDPTVAYFPVLRAPGPLAARAVTNLLQFEQCYCRYTTSAGGTVHALLPELQATYSIELQTPVGGHVRWLADNVTTDTGEINETWDLKDDSGDTYAGDTVNAVFTVGISVSGASGTESVPLFRSDAEPYEETEQGEFPRRGVVTVAYCYNDGTLQGDIDFVVQSAIVEQLIALCNDEFCYDYPYRSYFNSVLGLGGQGQSGYLPNQASVEPLLQNLSNTNIGSNPPTKNFIFLGHSECGTIGGENSPKIDLNYLAHRLDNYDFMCRYYGGHIPPPNPYRFVFLCGCWSATDTAWAHVFGIYDYLTTEYLSSNPRHVQAFVGFDKMAFPPGWGPVRRFWFLDEFNAWNLFFAMWQSGFTLDDCIDYTAVCDPPSPFDGDDLSYWNFREYQDVAAWASFAPPDQRHTRLRVYGYCGLTRTSFVPGYNSSYNYGEMPPTRH